MTVPAGGPGQVARPVQTAWAMPEPPQTPFPDDGIDETGAESFPASDAPAWTAVRAGHPQQPPLLIEHGHDVRAALRADLERLETAQRSGESGPEAVEEVIVRILLDAGRAVGREPAAEGLRIRNVEAELLGAVRQDAGVVVAALYDGEGTRGVAMLLAMARALARERLRRTVRWVAIAEGGTERYARRLQSEGKAVQASLFLAPVGGARAAAGAPALFVGDLRSRRWARAARDGFRASSRLSARAIALPRWFPGMDTMDSAVFWRHGWPAVRVTDRSPWASRGARRAQPDVDWMAAALPGLASAVIRLAGGRA